MYKTFFLILSILILILILIIILITNKTENFNVKIEPEDYFSKVNNIFNYKTEKLGDERSIITYKKFFMNINSSIFIPLVKETYIKNTGFLFNLNPDLNHMNFYTYIFTNIDNDVEISNVSLEIDDIQNAQSEQIIKMKNNIPKGKMSSIYSTFETSNKEHLNYITMSYEKPKLKIYCNFLNDEVVEFELKNPTAPNKDNVFYFSIEKDEKDLNKENIIFYLNGKIEKRKIQSKINNNNKQTLNIIKFKNMVGTLGRVLSFLDYKTNNQMYDLYSTNTCNFYIDKLDSNILTVFDCIKECNKYEQCKGNQNCQNICLNCSGINISEEEKYNVCPWYNKIHPKNTLSDFNIRGIPGNSQILIEWKKPSGDIIIDKYVLEIKEEYKLSKNINISIINSNCDICEYVIPNLKNNVSYKINIIAIAGEQTVSSNTIKVTPNGINTESLEYLYKDLDGQYDNNDLETILNCSENYNDEDHALDLLDLDNINLGKTITEL